MVKRVIFGAVANEHVAALTDLNAASSSCSACSRSAVLALGLWPAPLLEVMHKTVEKPGEQITASKL